MLKYGRVPQSDVRLYRDQPQHVAYVLEHAINTSPEMVQWILDNGGVVTADVIAEVLTLLPGNSETMAIAMIIRAHSSQPIEFNIRCATDLMAAVLCEGSYDWGEYANIPSHVSGRAPF